MMTIEERNRRAQAYLDSKRSYRRGVWLAVKAVVRVVAEALKGDRRD